MEVHLAPGQPARLTDVDDLRRFSVIMAGSQEGLASLAEALHGIVAFEGSEHAWVSVDWLVETSGRSGSAEWRDQFAAMVAYARSKGWMRTDPEAIRGHVVRQAG
ncbi:hypothetical protein KPL78_12890 [Roseomonas sp. HJA6]|uniref:Antibiotic biosynthesis monooxygenase n=1 Tax=Roseomonas alba TaxID=2846776 RepID=A0ABS7A9A8_9PROT|nr:hypothetical protein [Neoroseomonas alba]MBW6398753.1 hypothetical protein [Neoroseomonas alba]